MTYPREGDQMMKRSITASTLLTMLSGDCGDPETSRLAVRSNAIVLDRYKKYGGVRVDIEGMDFPLAEDGTRVTVVNDEREDGLPSGLRKVRVRFREGALAERNGTITRWSLRPE
jgi:hypothetical protein